MSFGRQKVFSGIQEALVLALMLVTMFALFYVDLAIVYKVSIAVIAFLAIFLTTIATQILRAQKESRKAAVA
jgi:membrane protein YdbS with pleckstrin-like domain